MFDVVIAGAGPSGCATALSLACVAPQLRVCLVGPDDALALIGETVPPSIHPILAHLGLLQQFEAAEHRPSYRTVSAWGDGRLVADEFLFHTGHRGWRLDRMAFDGMMREAALRTTDTRSDTVIALAREGVGWRATLGNGDTVEARVAVDATGRAAALARCMGLPREATDALVCCAAIFSDASERPGDLLLETVPDGWWYTAGLPGAQRIVALMTDSDRVRRLGVRRESGFLEQMRSTRHLRGLARGAVTIEAPRIHPARSVAVRQPTEMPFLCVGDAVACFDPASGQGILKALRSGVFASYAIADLLLRNDRRGLIRHAILAERDFGAYLAMLGKVYARETRWRDRPFWRRRLPPVTATAPSSNRNEGIDA